MVSLRLIFLSTFTLGFINLASINESSANTCDAYVSHVTLKSNIEDRKLPVTSGNSDFVVTGKDIRIETFRSSGVYQRHLVISDLKVIVSKVVNYWGSHPAHYLTFEDLDVMDELFRQISLGQFAYFDLTSSSISSTSVRPARVLV